MKIQKIEKSILAIFYSFLGIGVIGILIFIGIYACKGHLSLGELDFKKISSFGDFVGGFIGTIFTIAATLLIWLTYQSQKLEFRKANKLSKQQTKLLNIQKFEGTFFELLKMHYQNLESISIIITIPDQRDIMANQARLPKRASGPIHSFIPVREYRDEISGKEAMKFYYEEFEKYEQRDIIRNDP